MTWLKRFILSIQFLTRIPIPLQLNVGEEDFAKSMVFFPVVGVIIGAVMLLGAYCVIWLQYGRMAMIVALLLQVMITGALHQDGLGDTCDGIFSNKSRERMLEIMRDSRIGMNACIAVFFDLILKAVMLTEIYMNYGDEWIFVLLATPVLGKVGIVTASGISRYARKEGGLGSYFLDGVGFPEWMGSVVFGGVILYLLLGMKSILFLFTVLAGSILTAKFLERRLGGLTGDTLGAINEISEMLFLLSYGLLRSI
ncbi:MAG: adenosylcobinamide-GDP ribazoletransferase [Clostridia bacterium]